MTTPTPRRRGFTLVELLVVIAIVAVVGAGVAVTYGRNVVVQARRQTTLHEMGQLRDAFARVAKELLREDRVEEAVELLDLGLEKLPTSQIRFTDANTYPFLEAYYAAGAMGDAEASEKGDALLREYTRTLIEYIEYYLRFEGAQGDMVSDLIDEKLDQLGDVYYLASYAGRRDVVAELNDYYRSLGVSEENLINVGDKPQPTDSSLIAPIEADSVAQ